MKINECVFKLQICLFIMNFAFQLQVMHGALMHMPNPKAVSASSCLFTHTHTHKSNIENGNLMKWNEAI